MDAYLLGYSITEQWDIMRETKHIIHKREEQVEFYPNSSN
jgi:hypothetical protein